MSDEQQKPVENKADEFKKTSVWKRPIAMAKDSNTGAWLMLLGAACLSVALWGPISRLYWRMHNKAVSADLSAIERTSDCFVAISYEGVAKEPEPWNPFISTANFQEHLIALKEAGYNPITLEDVRAFYHDNRLLPEKAVLMTFENCHKSTYFEIRDILSKQRWHAVMGVVTKPVREDNIDVLLRPYLKGMVLDATWDLANQSDEGTTLIPTTMRGRQGLFFTSPKWLKEENRNERFEEFRARIELDHAKSIAEFTNNLNMKPIAFFFPNGNYGQYEENNQLLREANLEIVEQNYDLGFILNNNALNDSGTDPRRINRLQVPGKWSAKELVDRLNNSWPAATERTLQGSKIIPERWIVDWGKLEKKHSSVTLSADTAIDQLKSDAGATGDARAWIAGSNSFKDGSVSLRFQLVRGEMHLYLRFNADDSFIRIAVTDGGRASITQCVPGEEPKGLAYDAITTDSDFRTNHSLFVTLRDDVIFVRLDGKVLFDGAVLVEEGQPGMVGMGVWTPAVGLAQVNVTECYLRSRIDAVVTWKPSINRATSYLMRSLRENAFRYTIISPPWLDVYAASPITFPAIDAEALNIIALSNHNKVYPSLALHDAESLATIKTYEIIDNLKDDNAHGLFVDASDFPPDKISALKNWITTLNQSLEKEKLGLAIRFPLAIANLTAIGAFVSQMPNTVVVDDNANVPAGISPLRALHRIMIDPPASDEDMTLFYQLNDFTSRPPDAVSEAALFRKIGLKAYAEGRYKAALDNWLKWQAADPRSAEAWTFVGNAYVRLRNHDKAAEAYGESLDIEPGQIQLMLERVRALSNALHDDKASNLLDTYARAFPDNTAISIAQALWLDKHGHRSAGRALLSSVVTNNPSDINCRLTLQGLLDNPLDRYRNMHELLTIGTKGDSQLLGFGHDIETAELLTIPESSVFFDLIRNTSISANTEATRKLYESFMPLTNSISEKFDASHLSDNWIALGTPLTYVAGTYDLQAASDMAEAYLRLRKSELMRDGFIEVTLSESVGAFWLYARRSSKSMIRFGFDGDGYVRIQTWYDGDIRTGESIAWVRPAGDITLRLEVRGDGAYGIIDGKQMFSTPLKIPDDIAYGWWSIAPFSPELGIARARIGKISAGPISPALVLMRETDPEFIAAHLDKLRPYSRCISALSPVLFVQSSDGTIISDPMTSLMPFKMFSSYHRIRLMPAVALDHYSDVNPEDLIQLLHTHKLSGLVLIVRIMPKEPWFKKLTALLEQTTADMIIVQSEDPIWPKVQGAKSATETTVREIQRGSLLFQPNQDKWDLSITPMASWDPAENREKSSTPTIVIVPQTEPPPPPEKAMAPAPTPEEITAPTKLSEPPVIAPALPPITPLETVTTNALSN